MIYDKVFAPEFFISVIHRFIVMVHIVVVLRGIFFFLKYKKLMRNFLWKRVDWRMQSEYFTVKIGSLCVDLQLSMVADC